MIRITGGKFKQKKLASINDFVRPTSSLKREAFFSIIESYAIKNSIELYKNKIFLDLFAGIGTMGLEAISRGMSEVIFFENNIEVINILTKNCLGICKNNQFKIYDEDLINSKLEIEFQNISVIYIDPPFDVGADFSMDIEIGDETLTKNPSVIEELAYRDTWGKGDDSFLSMIYERLILMKDLLADDGLIFVHCDYRLNSALRLVLNEVFNTTGVLVIDSNS